MVKPPVADEQCGPTFLSAAADQRASRLCPSTEKQARIKLCRIRRSPAVNCRYCSIAIVAER